MFRKINNRIFGLKAQFISAQWQRLGQKKHTNFALKGQIKR